MSSELQKKFIKTFLSFTGRIGRKQYFFTRLLFLIPSVMGYMLFENSLLSNAGIFSTAGLFSIVLLLLMIPFNFSAIIRRWHDLNRSGGFVIINMIGQSVYLIGIIVELYLCLKAGTPGNNNYGPNPTSSLKQSQTDLSNPN